jgi:NADH:ubiquinone oxidoreductase subunit F (NADH-binding)
LTKITEGIGSKKDIDDLQDISKWLYEMSNCGLGQTAGSPLKDIFNHFHAEVEAHIIQKECPAGVCPMSGKSPTLN